MKKYSRIHPLCLALAAAGFCSFPGIALATNNGVTASTTSSAINVGEVSSTTGALDTLGHLPSKKQVFESTQSIKVIGKKQMETAGPAGGAGQALAVAPGVNTQTDSPAGASRATISINGMKTGWSNIAGNANDGTVMVTFDGVPMVDPAYGVWGTPEVPQMSMIKGIAVTYGPGYPINRWFNNIGGSINFIPLQPTAKAGASIGGFYGSFNTRGVHFNVRTGNIDGWSAIIAGGMTSAGNYLNGYGFNNPSNNYAYYAKVIKKFHGGHFSFGAYAARGVSYRPLAIPVSPNSNVTVNGTDANGNPIPGPIYSQQTTGFYTTLPYSEYWKEAFNTSYILYSKFFDHLSRDLTLHNLLWYRHGSREHLHYNYYTGGYSNVALNQYYLAKSDTYGDKLYFTDRLPWNTVSFGGYFLNNKYNSLLEFYNSSPTQAQYNPIIGAPVNGSLAVPNGDSHSSYMYMTDLAAFIQDDIQPVRNVRITPGLRVVTFNTNFVNNEAAQFPLNGYNNGVNSYGTSGDRQPNSSTSFTDVEPSIGANWQITPNVAVYANYSTAYKAPAGATGTYAHDLASSLKPQSSTQYQFGVKAYVPHDGLLNHASFGANYYHLNDTNEIIPIPVVSHLYSLFASGSSTFSGVNLYFEDDPLYNIHIFSNLSFEKAVYSNYVNPHGVSYDGLPVSDVPAQTANIGAYYQWYHAGVVYEPRIWWQYTGAQSIYNNNTGAPTNQKLPAFGIWNAALRVNIGHQYLFAGLHKLSVNVDVLNLLNKQYNSYQYISSGGYYGVAGQMLADPGMPRAVFVSLEGHFA
ncbi:TonB-dependent receptor [Acidithiobacillus sulfuriphilus]|uniref:TonB-dependent receptor n=2 Tax=Acidithiobacillus sulfuriphilus TaxID=1867749 RepID=A0A3M8QYE3_9PROT|nr:TonB-dependent receptor [Acidithiobacillus sulfuriphilus]RNF60452.1 TonB-dependent receptor [Acidithiobacillus sulfuriphilus]